jgi:single-strand DNA-binding protein
MFDTYVTVVGNVLTAPVWRRTTQTGTLVASFKVASTARRLDRETNRWIDGNSLRVRVSCWRRLAEGVASSVMTGDPVIVVGRLYTRDWVDADNNHRTAYELEAVAVGHDLSRGRGKFARTRAVATTSVVDDEESEQQVRGEPSAPVAEADAPARLGDNDRYFDDDGDGADRFGGAPSIDEELAGLVATGGSPARAEHVRAQPSGVDGAAPDASEPEASGPDGSVGSEPAVGGGGRSGRRTKPREPQPA